MSYLAQFDSAYPADFWPGRILWTDPDGSRGTWGAPALGVGPRIFRLRAPATHLEEWWKSRISRFVAPPEVTVGPLETPGLADWLISQGYTLSERELLMALQISGRSNAVRPVVAVTEVTDAATLHQMFMLTSLVFGGEPPTPEMSEFGFQALGIGSTRIYVVVDPKTGQLIAAGAMTMHPGWAFLWAGQVHPDHRRQGLYRALLEHRLKAAADLGAVFAATQANPTTSAPQLAKVGFLTITALDFYRLNTPWAAPDQVSGIG